MPRLEFSTTNVGFPDQVRENRAGFGVFQVQCHAQLVAEPIESRDRDIIFGFPREFRAVCTEVRRVGPARIAACGVFNLDHFRAKACQNQRGKRPGECDSQIEDGDSIQGLVQVYFSR